jgi:hypothetical protein
MKTTIGELSCNVCNHKYDIIPRRFALEIVRFSEDTRRVEGEPCRKEITYESECTGKLSWYVRPEYLMCKGCGEHYDMGRGLSAGDTCIRIKGRNKDTGAIYRCGSTIIEQHKSGILKCDSCNYYFTLLENAGRCSLGCSDDVDVFSGHYAKPARMAQGVRAPEGWVQLRNLSDEISYDADGNPVIPADRRNYVEVGPNATGRMHAQLSGYPDSWMKDDIAIAGGTPGWPQGLAALYARVGSVCGRTISMTGVCPGTCILQSREVELLNPTAFDHKTRNKGVAIKKHEICYQEVV